MNARSRFDSSSFILPPWPGARAKPRRYGPPRAARRAPPAARHPSWGRLPTCPTAPRAFTLVEMLVVIVILTMLAAMVLFALRGVQQSAREQKTRATIQKLHNIVMELYESYKTRRVPITLPPGTNPRDAAIARLAALRDLMRMEMPERKSDLIDPQTGNPRGPFIFPWGSVPQPALYQAYLGRLSAATAPMNKNAPAECLYLIVTLAGGEDARAQFGPDEVGDTDGNGLPEFIDGWGRPIFFLRWAPGFNDSDLQWNIFLDQDRVQAAQKDHDPFDPRKVDASAWRLVPLIYSAGPDGQYGVATELIGGTYVWANDTYAPAYSPPILMGTPARTATGAVDTHYDNIHNHRVETP